jgi:hypothetical protein
MNFLTTLSPLERFWRGHAVLPPNRWHQPCDGRGRPSPSHWMCLRYDVELHKSGRWRATELYQTRRFENEVGGRDFATAEAAMHAVDEWCSRQWC